MIYTRTSPVSSDELLWSEECGNFNQEPTRFEVGSVYPILWWRLSWSKGGYFSPMVETNVKDSYPKHWLNLPRNWEIIW